MKQNKRGILMFASMILSIGLICGVQVVQAENGDINSVLLKDTDSNGKIDEVHVTVDYTGTTTATVTADAIAHEDSETATIGKFAVTDTGTTASVAIISIEFVSGDGVIAIFKLTLNEANVSDDTSETALNVFYDASDSDLKITSGSVDTSDLESVVVKDIDVEEEDGAAPVAISATCKDTDSDGKVDRIDVTYSEDIEENSTFVESEWSFLPNPHDLVILPDTSTISLTDVCIEVTSDSATINDTTVRYTATIDTDGGITDGVNYAIDAELPVGADEDYIPVPGYGTARSKQPNPNSGVTLYRVGDDPRVYVIKNKKKHWIKTPKEFEDNNYSWSAVQVVSAEVLGEYPDEETSTTELLRAVGSHKVYKIENGKKRWIKTAGEFNAAGYKWKDIKEVSLEALASYQNAVLSELLRAVGDYKVYKLKGGKKHWVRTIGEFNAAGYKWKDVEEVTIETLDDYPDPDPETTQ